MPRSKPVALGVLIGSIATVGIAAVAGIAYVYSGSYNVAATESHAPTMRWALDTSYENSVRSRAETIEPPAELTPEMVEAGGERYAAMCAHCHGGPGAEPAGWSRGMRPEPPILWHAASEWESREVFWLVKHGVKMSGMPAFGTDHEDAAIWEITAFVKELPAMRPETYESLTAGANGHGQSTESHSE
ncbi:di-heme cytochrome c (class I) [Pseudooceanicola batsensis HTCC2597]|uniref:Di-heme cytochrome c (Class I) n=2 Tax=Rhodobacterales TaxID=204455 RepID=A3TSJ1_PSEBH|nr:MULTISPECIES: cytochrome c [Rhodobacterales]EAQ04618.1 di-heme cytochrome c (class I) [Pseudooceanicola batsensis HTCC2597]